MHKVSAGFDDPNLVSAGGLGPVLALAERAGLHELVEEHLTVPGSAGANTALKIPGLVAGMVAWADSITDMGLLRHGGMGRLFCGVRAPTTLGTCLRGFTFGHVRQLDAVASRLLVAAGEKDAAAGGADQVAFVDIDDTMPVIARVHRENYGVYGIRKVHAALNREQVLAASAPVARCTTQRLMKDLGLRGISRAKGPRTTVPGTGPDTRPDLVNRTFTAELPDRLWVADITYVRTFAGWVYCAFVLDVFSRRVVGWQISTSLRTDLALDALNIGLWTPGPRRSRHHRPGAPLRLCRG